VLANLWSWKNLAAVTCLAFLRRLDGGLLWKRVWPEGLLDFVVEGNEGRLFKRSGAGIDKISAAKGLEPLHYVLLSAAAYKGVINRTDTNAGVNMMARVTFRPAFSSLLAIAWYSNHASAGKIESVLRYSIQRL
jgi:hypothetical protein